MTASTYHGVDVPGVRAQAGGFIHATVVPAGCDLIFVSGQTPEDLDGSVSPDFEQQARMAWRNVEARSRPRVAPSITWPRSTCTYATGVTASRNRTVRNEVLGDR